MEEDKEESIDDIIKSIRSAVAEKDINPYARLSSAAYGKKDEVFLLSKNMLVKREDIPYQLGVWNFDDVAKKMMKKYRNYFNRRFLDVVRVRVKEENKA
ncbi:MAG: hypothetical protein IJ677_02220 [Alphaproteobacteria bacterium]|nr:hypothetical protein [Alphaproteobacteria bacterium]